MRPQLPLLALILVLQACPQKADDVCDTDAGCDTDIADTDIGDDTDVQTGCGVTPPSAYAAPDWAANTVDALALRAALDALTGATTMRGAEQGTAVVDALTDLTAPYEAGTPSLSDVASPGWDPVVGDAFAEFLEVLDAGAVDLVDGDGQWTPGAAGGLFETSFRGINEGGLEVRQIVDKGLFGGGAFYPYALGLTEDAITPATIDAIAAVWGADSVLDPAVVTDSANYADSMGYFEGMATSLIAARAYAASPDCVVERDEALVSFFRTWELSLIARFVHYANVAHELIAAPAGDADLANAVHELSEGVGLGLGFLGMTDPVTGPLAGSGRRVTDAEIQAMAAAVGVNLADLGASTSGGFLSDPTGYAAGLVTMESVVKTTYGVDEDDLQAWRAPAED